MMAVANCSAGVFNNPPSIAHFFHSFSHANFSFDNVSSIFIPTFADYQQVWNVLFCYCPGKLENLSSCAFELLFRFTRSRLQNVMTMSDRTQNVRWRGRERLIILPSGYWTKMFLWSLCCNLHLRQSVSESYVMIIRCVVADLWSYYFFRIWNPVGYSVSHRMGSSCWIHGYCWPSQERVRKQRTLMLFNEMQIS